MKTLNECVKEYTIELQKGHIQKAYKGIMTFMSSLQRNMINNHPTYTSSGIYFGYMDMTYFAFTPLKLKKEHLKIAIVYLHEKNSFEVWLGGNNRKVKLDFTNQLKQKDLSGFTLSSMEPGVDSIIEAVITQSPDFDQPEVLMHMIEDETLKFINRVTALVVE